MNSKSEKSPYRWFILAGVWLLYCGFGFTATGLAPLVLPITQDLNMSHGEMGMVLGSWQLIFILSALPCGILLERIGPRWSLLLAAIFIAASGIARGYAVDFWSLLLAVCLFGFGAPLLSVGAPKTISMWFSDTERGFAMGIYITSPSIGGIVALTFTNPVLLPLFEGDWRLVLLIWAGATLAAGLIWFIIASHPAQRALEAQLSATPSLPQGEIIKRLLRDPVVLLILAMSVGIFLYNHGINNWLPELLRTRGMTATEAGYLAAIPTVAGIFSALIIPRLAIPTRRSLFLILLATSALLAMLLLLTDNDPLLYTGLMLQGLARGSLMTISVLILIESKSVGSQYAGTASGLFFSAAEIGGVSGPVVLGLLYDVTGTFNSGLWFLAGIALVILSIALALRRWQEVQSR